MKHFFNFTSGEISASISLSIIIITLFTFRVTWNWGQYKSNIPIQFWQNISMYNSNQILKNPSDSIKKKTKKEKILQYEIVKIDLNHCDTNDIKGIPLFGSTRAKKLIEYRDQLGGFYSLSQVQEIFILKEIELDHLETYFYIKSSDIKLISINIASYEQLKKHPYLDSYLAKQILIYREQNGRINNMEEFQKATHAYEALVKKIKPYLSFD
jgi:competence protein ComEA